MGSAGRACRFLPAVRRRGSRLEVAERGGERAARLLGQPFVLAADRARTRRRSGSKCAARRAQELVFVPAQLFACLANGSGGCFRTSADDVKRLDLFSSAGWPSGKRQIAPKEQRPEGSGNAENANEHAIE